MDSLEDILKELSPEEAEKLQRLPLDEQNQFRKLLQRIRGEGNVITAPSGTQYIHPIDILLSTKVRDDMQKLINVLGEPQEGSNHDQRKQ